MGSLKESYSKMFSLPRREILVLLTVSITILNVIIFTKLIPLIPVTLAVGVPYLILLVLILPENKRILNLKRTIFLVLLLELSLFVYLLGVLFLNTQLLSFGIYLALGIAFIALIATIDVKSIYTTLLIVVVGELICVGISYPWVIRSDYILLVKLNFAMLIYILFFYLGFVRGNKATLGKIEVGAFEFLKAYLFLHFRDRNDLIEKIFEKASIEREVPVISTLFVSEDGPILALVSTPIHPGPLRSCGSSRLPLHLYNEVESKLGCKTIFLKGAGSHDSNIPSDLLTRRFARDVAEFLEKTYTEFCSETMPFPGIIHSGIIKATILDTCDNRYILVTSHPKPTDDISVDLSYLALELGRVVGKRVALVDMHNSLTIPETGKKMNVDDSGYRDILRVLAESLKIELKPSLELSVGVARGHCAGIGLYEGLGPLGIIVASFRIGTEHYFIVEFDSNNITPELHDAVVDSISRKYNAKLVSVISTDTHMVTGLTHKTMYTILGQIGLEKILNCTLSLAEKAYRSMKKAKIATGFTTITTKVLGVDTQNQLFGMATEGVKMATKLFKITLTLSTIAVIAILL